MPWLSASGATEETVFPSASAEAGDLLPGVTREVVLELASEESFSVEEGRYGLEQVRGADEAFLTNSTWELRPVTSLDGRTLGEGPITTLLTRLYESRVEATCY